ncbi:MAG: hypothetical protein ORN51_03875 [Akkermansiaceae bacterium]|nr:hypothetical protein [Akkermansiaceae bacterium]
MKTNQIKKPILLALLTTLTLTGCAFGSEIKSSETKNEKQLHRRFTNYKAAYIFYRTLQEKFDGNITCGFKYTKVHLSGFKLDFVTDIDFGDNVGINDAFRAADKSKNGVISEEEAIAYALTLKPIHLRFINSKAASIFRKAFLEYDELIPFTEREGLSRRFNGSKYDFVIDIYAPDDVIYLSTFSAADKSKNGVISEEEATAYAQTLKPIHLYFINNKASSIFREAVRKFDKDIGCGTGFSFYPKFKPCAELYAGDNVRLKTSVRVADKSKDGVISEEEAITFAKSLMKK